MHSFTIPAGTPVPGPIPVASPTQVDSPSDATDSSPTSRRVVSPSMAVRSANSSGKGDDSKREMASPPPLVETVRAEEKMSRLTASHILAETHPDASGFTVQKIVGEGSYARVVLAQHQNIQVVMKEFFNTHPLLQETNALLRFAHPH